MSRECSADIQSLRRRRSWWLLSWCSKTAKHQQCTCKYCPCAFEAVWLCTNLPVGVTSCHGITHPEYRRDCRMGVRTLHGSCATRTHCSVVLELSWGGCCGVTSSWIIINILTSQVEMTGVFERQHCMCVCDRSWAELSFWSYNLVAVSLSFITGLCCACGRSGILLVSAHNTIMSIWFISPAAIPVLSHTFLLACLIVSDST